MKCDIIIPVWNQLSHTKRCLESIRQHADYPYRIIVIDNGSEKDTKDFLDRQKRENGELLVITNEANRGYIRAINQGLAAATADYICLLNNDTVVTPGWLTRMISLAESDPRIGIVNPQGNVGRKLKKLTRLTEISASLMQNQGEYVELERCSGFCFLFKREVLEAVGYFDESFGMGYFEDSDYCQRAREKGYLSVRALDSYVYHYMGESFRKLKDRQKLFDKNKALFWLKWGRVPQIIYPFPEILPGEEAGLGRYIRTCHALARERCKVKSILGRASHPTKDFSSWYGLKRHINLRFYAFSGFKIIFLWKSAFYLFCLLKIRHLIKKGKGDLVLLGDLKLASFLLKFKRFLKVPFIFEADETFRWASQKIKRRTNYVLNEVQAIITPIPAWQKEIAEEFAPDAPIHLVTEQGEERAKRIIEIAKGLLGW